MLQKKRTLAEHYEHYPEKNEHYPYQKRTLQLSCLNVPTRVVLWQNPGWARRDTINWHPEKLGNSLTLNPAC